MQIYSRNMQKWFVENHRELPWRETKDPYKIWISEIILQQTRVNQGYDYYLRFIERFPDIKTLATADETEVLRFWQGLGYYSRARNLHFAARQIVEYFGGIFPDTFSDVLKLKGVGVYTAAAVCSFAYNQPVAAVDGNVYRVLARLFDESAPIDTAEGQKIFANLAAEILDKHSPSAHNQSIMEFGALLCVPVSPDCNNCVLQDHCQAFAKKTVDSLPVKAKKTKVVERFFNYIIINEKENIFIKKRIEKDIWRGLYDFPLIESGKLFSKNEFLENEQVKNLLRDVEKIFVNNFSATYKHILTHRKIFAQFIEIEIAPSSKALEKQYIKIKHSDIANFPLPRLIDKYLCGCKQFNRAEDIRR
ncbi:MAG: A/G-specific adenine glycosylase [Tannerella sp.]|nr:A/G-specific adenine glycosylase [Tannerella sp.]